MVELAELAARGVHDPDFMPFMIPWTDVETGGAQERGSLQHMWGNLATFSTEHWILGFITTQEGRVVGSQGISAKHFARRRVVETGSWLGRDFHGQGLGKEQRAAVLHFAFAGLGALRAESGAFHDNAPSLAVSRSLGYEENGDGISLRRDGVDRIVNLKLIPERWEAHRPDYEIAIDGHDPCLPLLGA